MHIKYGVDEKELSETETRKESTADKAPAKPAEKKSGDREAVSRGNGTVQGTGK